jgi:CDP-6-deoxy-D-xylo-4-hexulose-3-dehydrase
MIRLAEPTFGEEEISAVVECMRSTQVTSGEKVRAFEREFSASNLLSCWDSVACNSGSSANLLAISALVSTGRLKAGDEVIVSALSWSTTVWPLIQHGLVPVFVDCDAETLCISPAAVAEAIGSKVRAIMPVHVYGNPCDMDALFALCRKEGLGLIEDCCEALGAEYEGRPVGTFGDVATFSFYYSHHITTMEGGMAVTLDHDLAETMRIQRAHGWVRDCESPERWTEQFPEFDPKFLFVDIGYNLRMTEPQAAMGLCQLPKLKGIVEKRRANLKRYQESLPWLRTQAHREGSSCFGFNFLVEDRDRVAKGLNTAGIETRPIIAGNLARQPALKRYHHRVSGPLFNADYVLRHGLSVGCHQGVTEEDIAYVVKTLEALCGRG